MREIVDIKSFAENPIKLISENWMLISSGDRDNFNTMTASWGGVGFLWNKPVAFIFVRSERYTFEFIESNDLLTLSFFSSEYKSALTVLGTKSGRDGDKVAESGLTPEFTELGNPTFKEANIVMECKKLYAEELKDSSFLNSEDLQKWYGAKGGMHKMYVVEILSVEQQ